MEFGGTTGGATAVRSSMRAIVERSIRSPSSEQASSSHDLTLPSRCVPSRRTIVSANEVAVRPMATTAKTK
jgi:hypothetical protein